MLERFTQIGTHPSIEAPMGASIPSMYALVANAYMHRFGTTALDLAEVAVAARTAAADHPGALKREPLTTELVLGSPMVSDPLHVLDCCLIADFAVALVLTTSERARDLDRPGVGVLGAGEGFTHEFLFQAPNDIGRGARQAVDQALVRADVARDDIDLLELYDCFTITTIVLLEQLGFVDPGCAGPAFRNQEFARSGRLPLNTHGGLLSYGSGGITHIAEAVHQLRGEAGHRQAGAPQRALVHNLGGILSMHVSLVLGAPGSY
jgi:acetyl-CoA acetyltransferase